MGLLTKTTQQKQSSEAAHENPGLLLDLKFLAAFTRRFQKAFSKV
jgi:hypothetical protein